jgi:hypothetical protein
LKGLNKALDLAPLVVLVKGSEAAPRRQSEMGEQRSSTPCVLRENKIDLAQNPARARRQIVQGADRGCDDPQDSGALIRI